MTEDRSLEGWEPGPDVPLADVVESAFDYRGNVTVESPDFLEIGVTADSRITQIVAVNHEGEDQTLSDLVRRRLPVDGNEATLRDPGMNLADVLG